MLVIINYGLGNLASVLNMVRKVGGNGKISSDRNELLHASKLILPGVGSFDYGVNHLHSQGFFSIIQEMASKGIPILGICLGMQLLGNRSEEGRLDALGLIDAEFRRFSFENNSQKLQIPHVGWNYVSVVKENLLIPNSGSEQRFYFTHSYHAVCAKEADVLATTTYGYTFTSAYSRDNIFGVQFHPEKSHRFGMALIKNFLKL
jgi:glutamine amidotransferase